MSTLAQVALLLTLLVEPLLALLVDTGPHRRGRRGRAAGRPTTRDVPAVRDLTVVVPVHGDPRVLDGLDHLAEHGDDVLLVTTAEETRGFYRRLWALAGEHGYRVHVAGRVRPVADDGGAARTGTGVHDAAGTGVRGALLRDAHGVLRSAYVVCVDPGTLVAARPGQLVGALVDAGLEVGTVTTAEPGRGLLGRLLRVQDALAAPLRRRAPWLVRGGVLVARRTVHADVLQRHTLFGPGDDAETAWLAVARGHRTGLLDVSAVPAASPTPRLWWHRRVDEAAGAFRLTVVNTHLGLRHPSAAAAGTALTFALVPGLWWAVLHAPWAVPPVLVLHGAVTAVAVRGLRDRVVWLYPALALVRVLVLLPLGCVAYVLAAVRAGELGIVRARDPWWLPAASPVAPVRRLPGPGLARATDWWARR